MDSLTTTNVWLAILAVVSLLEFLMIVAAAAFAFKVYRQVMVAVQTVERVHIAPVRARVDGILDEVQVMTQKVRRLQESVEDALRHVAGTGSQVADAVRSRTWPIVGIMQGIRAAANTVTGNGKKDPPVGRYGT
jgi:uncharacterized protein YoxC